jgi:hypothetical protein
MNLGGTREGSGARRGSSLQRAAHPLRAAAGRYCGRSPFCLRRRLKVSRSIARTCRRCSRIRASRHRPARRPVRARPRGPRTGGRAPFGVGALLDHPIRPLQHRPGNRQAERLSGLEVDDQLERGHFLHREVGRFGSRALPLLRQRAPLIGDPSHPSSQAIISRPP